MPPFTLLVCIAIFSGSLVSSEKKTKAEKEIEEFDAVLREGIPLVVLFTQECCACSECVEAEVLLGGMSQQLEENVGVALVRLKEKSLRSRYGVKKVPAMVFIREGKAALYDGAFDLDSVYDWLQTNRQPATVVLDDSSFEHLTQAGTGATTGDWLVLFHNTECLGGRELIHLENAGMRMRNRVNVADVNIRNAPETAVRFKISGCPEVLFFRHHKMYRFSLSDITDKSLQRFAEGFYKNSKAENVPLPQSAFDKFLDKTIEFCNENWKILLMLLGGSTVCMVILALICTLMQPSPHKKSE